MRYVDRDHQTLIDEAKVYHVGAEAVRAIELAHWKSATIALLARVKKLDMALQSLTPGGSEYVGDPDRCVAVAREKLETYRRLWKEAATDKRVTKP